MSHLVSNGRDVSTVVDSWIDDNCVYRVGVGNSFLFWWKPWMKCVTLKDRSSRLFEFSDNKIATVVEMEYLGWVRADKLGSGTCLYGRGKRSNWGRVVLVWTLKVNLSVWCLLLNCLPTNNNLVKKGVIPDTSHQCVGGMW